jgi:hypothetical protein
MERKGGVLISDFHREMNTDVLVLGFYTVCKTPKPKYQEKVACCIRKESNDSLSCDVLIYYS